MDGMAWGNPPVPGRLAPGPRLRMQGKRLPCWWKSGLLAARGSVLSSRVWGARGDSLMRRRAGGKALASDLCPHDVCTWTASLSPPHLLEICFQKFTWELHVPEMDSIFIPSYIMFPEMFYHFCLVNCQCFQTLVLTNFLYFHLSFPSQSYP